MAAWLRSNSRPGIDEGTERVVNIQLKESRGMVKMLETIPNGVKPEALVSTTPNSLRLTCHGVEMEGAS